MTVCQSRIVISSWSWHSAGRTERSSGKKASTKNFPTKADTLLAAWLLHLVSNAIKFTERGGWAKIAAHSGPDGLAVEVSDNGVGMPPGAEAKILAPFSQYDSSLARTREGVGLGLTFVRRVADHHDAVLQIFSELGNGTRVVMNFPADRIVKVQEVA